MAFESSLAFGIYSQTKQLLQGETKSGKPQLLAIIPSAAFAGGLISFILCSSLSFTVQLTGIFCGGGAMFLRESIGNAVFFSTYEYVRYYMHKQLRNASSDLTHVIDVGVGIVSGGFGIEGQAFGIITPYNSQANLIRGVVPESVEIHTIDKYQRRDKDCILLSFVRSSKTPRNVTSSLVGDWH